MTSIPILPATDPPIPASDLPGSPRVVTNENGAVTSRKDFMAYGEKAAPANRVSGSGGNGYGPAGTRKDYTGYEKDEATGLDFAETRMYENRLTAKYAKDEKPRVFSISRLFSPLWALS